MPVFLLEDELIFPHPVLRDDDGLLAVGCDLSIHRLLLAYRWGLFPWYHDDQPILWWWLVPRLMIRPQQIHISHSLKSIPVSYTHLRAHETPEHLVCRLLLEK